MGLERKILNRIRDLGMTCDAAASLTGISGPRLSQFNRGSRDLDADSQVSLCTIISECESLARDYADIPIDWRQVAKIRDLLDSRREATRLRTPNEELVNIVLGEGDLFAGRADNSKGVPEIRVVKYPRNAAHVTRLTAQMLVTSLRNAGYGSARVVVNNNPGLATPQTFGKLWFTESERTTLDGQPTPLALQESTSKQ